MSSCVYTCVGHMCACASPWWLVCTCITLCPYTLYTWMCLCEGLCMPIKVCMCMSS